jgi:putative ABC transport system permease protein
MVVRKLAVSNFLTRKVRVALTVAAIALSVSLVVAVTSGYASVVAAAHAYLNKFMGATDVLVTRQGFTSFPESIVDEMLRDPDVARINPRLDTTAGLIRPDGEPITFSGAQIVGLRRPQDRNPESLTKVAGEWFETDDGNVAVIDQVASALLRAKVGDEFSVPGERGPLKLKVAAIVNKPAIMAAHQQTIYVPIKTLQRWAMPDSPPHVTRAMVELKSGANVDAFASRWVVRQKLGNLDPLLRIEQMRDNRKELDQNLQGVHVLSYMGGCVSMLAATFIVFSALSMGVAERQRTLAMLRAIGMHRAQIGRLVVGEGLLLAAVGVVIGVPLGLLWVKILTEIPQFRDLLPSGVVVSWGGILLGAGGSMLSALAASVLPAWNAMRVAPLEAMTPLAEAPASRVPWRLTVAGLLLLTVDTTLMFAPIARLGVSDELARAISFYGHFAVGIPSLMVGFFLLSPLFVYVGERTVGPLVSVMFGLRHALLRQQLSTGIWRAAGTCAALMVGLSILVVMNVQGHSAISTWRLPDRFPDVFIAAPPLSPLTRADIAKLEAMPELKPGHVMPMAIASPEFANPIFAMLGAAVLPNATMFIGVDPDKAFDMMQLDFRDGTPEQARELMKKGRHVVVTEEYKKLKGLGVGDTIKLKTVRNGEVDYTIAGVVWSPGLDVIVSLQDMGRQFETRTAATIFGTLHDAAKDFQVDRVFLVAANLETSHGLKREQVLERVQNQLGLVGMKVGDIRAIKYAIQEGFRRLLLFVSTVAVAAMAVASLGVTNTIMASIRSRRWQFGVLRSIGVTRSQLLRMVMAEATLLGFVGVALGLSAGALMSLDARGLSRLTVGFVPELAVPWTIVLAGSAAIMLITLVASLWPAVSVARTQPLELLQAGRASV